MWGKQRETIGFVLVWQSPDNSPYAAKVLVAAIVVQICRLHVASMLRGAADTNWRALKLLGKFLQHDAT
jgi:hypothetical protein